MKIYERLEILSILFQKPDGFLLDNIEKGRLREMLKIAFPLFEFEELDKKTYRQELLDQLKSDYLYLFVGASAPLASPYQSSYYRKNHRLMDRPAKNVIRIMKKWQIERTGDYRELPDHIVNILDLLVILLRYREENTNPIIDAELEKDINSLLKDRDWLLRFLERIKKSEKTGFYSKIGQLLIESLDQVE